MLVLVPTFFWLFPPFYTCTYWSCWACFVQSLGSAPPPTPSPRDARCPVDLLGCLCKQISGGGRWRRCRCGVLKRACIFIQNAPQIHRLIHPTRIFSFEMGSAPVTISPPHVPAHVTMSATACCRTIGNTFSCSVRSIGLFLVCVKGALHWFYSSDQVTHHEECGQLLCNVCCCFVEAVCTFTVHWVCGVRCVGLE